ncbi:hypothetical protein [Plantactinospora sp. GCM10030261]|uniref:hypothetical protein n=1 Tax=Plantactinospora sp. GCM10030261 TaxID=3273420 RepID=UPI00362194D1
MVAVITAGYAHSQGRPDDADLVRELCGRLEAVNDPQRQRYVELLSVVNGWPVPDDLAPAPDWGVQALRVRMPGAG